MSDDNFGFTPRKGVAERLAGFQPDQGEHEALDLPVDQLDALARRHGFDRRDAPSPTTTSHERPPRRGSVGPTIPLNMRTPVRVATPFIDWCNTHRFGYWEGLEELMKIAEILPRSGSNM